MLEHWNLKYIRGTSRQQSMGITNSREQTPIVTCRVINTPQNNIISLHNHFLQAYSAMKCDTWMLEWQGCCFHNKHTNVWWNICYSESPKGWWLNLNHFSRAHQHHITKNDQVLYSYLQLLNTSAKPYPDITRPAAVFIQSCAHLNLGLKSGLQLESKNITRQSNFQRSRPSFMPRNSTNLLPNQIKANKKERYPLKQ